MKKNCLHVLNPYSFVLFKLLVDFSIFNIYYAKQIQVENFATLKVRVKYPTIKFCFLFAYVLLKIYKTAHWLYIYTYMVLLKRSFYIIKIRSSVHKLSVSTSVRT